MAQATVVLLGWPLGHSISPAFQNAGFAACGLNVRYEARPVAPAGLAEAVAALRGRGYLGANVTVPHKEAVLGLVDDVTPEARRVGAVNTLLQREGQLVGHNTDVGGFAQALRECDVAVRGSRVLLLGAGGAARAAATVLLDGGADLAVYNRTPERAGALLAAVGGGRAVDAGEARRLAASGALHVVVNTTSAGLDGVTHPLDGLRVAPTTLCYDMVYNPPLTPFLRAAQRDGARTAGGLTMLVYQGAESFSLWTGQPAPLDVMMAAARAALPVGSQGVTHLGGQ